MYGCLGEKVSSTEMPTRDTIRARTRAAFKIVSEDGDAGVINCSISVSVSRGLSIIPDERGRDCNEEGKAAGVGRSAACIVRLPTLSEHPWESINHKMDLGAASPWRRLFETSVVSDPLSEVSSHGFMQCIVYLVRL